MLCVILTVRKEYQIRFPGEVDHDDVIRLALEGLYGEDGLVPSAVQVKADVYEGQEKEEDANL